MKFPYYAVVRDKRGWSNSSDIPGYSANAVVKVDRKTPSGIEGMIIEGGLGYGTATPLKEPGTNKYGGRKRIHDDLVLASYQDPSDAVAAYEAARALSGVKAFTDQQALQEAEADAETKRAALIAAQEAYAQADGHRRRIRADGEIAHKQAIADVLANYQPKKDAAA